MYQYFGTRRRASAKFQSFWQSISVTNPLKIPNGLYQIKDQHRKPQQHGNHQSGGSSDHAFKSTTSVTGATDRELARGRDIESWEWATSGDDQNNGCTGGATKRGWVKKPTNSPTRPWPATLHQRNTNRLELNRRVIWFVCTKEWSTSPTLLGTFHSWARVLRAN